MKISRHLITHFILLLVLLCDSCQAQTKKEKMEEHTNNNPLLCDPATGACEIPAGAAKPGEHFSGQNKPVKIVYFTDPICSSCWGIEPQLRRLKLEYGNDIQVEYRMGGLLPDWSYNSGGISKPSDVAHHWDEVSQYYRMPIDGDVWLEDPLHSSYPPSIAFKAAQMQDQQKAISFLRALRELVFLHKKNITKWEFIQVAAQRSGLDTVQLKKDYEGKARDLFQQDLELGRKMGVRGFPTLFVTDSTGNTETVYGFKPYQAYEGAVKKMYPPAIPHQYLRDWKSVFAKYPTLTTREFAELSDKTFEAGEKELEALYTEGQLTKVHTKNGDLWVRRAEGK